MKFATIALIASVSAINTARYMTQEAGVAKAAGYEEIPAFHADAAYGDGYTRVVPVQYREMRDDRLMNSLISKYAREVKMNGKLTGQMFLNKDDARSVADEVTRTSPSHIATSNVDFEGTWDHFDVNKDGLVEVERMPQFLRYLTNGALNPDL